MINELLKKENISRYQLSKDSNIPYSTLKDICNGKTTLNKCSAETVYRLAKNLNVTMESLLEPFVEKRPSFELFKSNVCHLLSSLGDIDFLIYILENDDIRNYYERKWYSESFYLLAMIDYISRLNNISICEEYDDTRSKKLKDIIYPASIIALSKITKSDNAKKLAIKNAIPEFLKYNIVESEVRNVI